MITMANKKEFLGEALIEKGLITRDQLQLALEEQKKSGELLGNILVKKKYVSEETMVILLSVLLGVDYVDLSSRKIHPDLIQSVPENIARKFKVIPLEKNRNVLTLAMVDPKNIFALDEIKSSLNCTVEPRIATESGIKRALERCYGGSTKLKEIITSAQDEIESMTQLGEESRMYDLSDEDGNAVAIRLVNQLLTDAVKDNVSDIHIEPQIQKTVTRFRKDGLLHGVISIPKHLHEAIVSRVKIMARLDIAERRMPQDGKFPMKVEKSDIDVRVSIYPTINGEKIVMRILNRTAVTFGIESLDFDKGASATFMSLIKKPHGILLVTGPTGSGKTSTLYTVLETIKCPEKNLVTIEDPVEYELSGITQSQTNSKIGLDFAILLRSLLRQDPDVVLVGEIRDLETAEVAIRAALTGHLVLATLHTNDAPGAIIRLIDMGIKPYLVASSTIGVIAQRLIRTICSECREELPIKPEVRKNLELPKGHNLYHGRGCDQCNGTGYSGRTAIFEIMPIDEELKSLITRKASSGQIKRAARKKGMRTLREDALGKVLKGATTIEEALRVVGESSAE